MHKVHRHCVASSPHTTTIMNNAIITIVFPAGEIFESIFSPNKRITPKKPVRIPVIIYLLLKFALRFLESNSTNHSGAADTKTATNELGKIVSAQIIDPLPTKSKRLPTINDVFICERKKSLYFLNEHHNNKTNPDAKKRTAPKRKGVKSLSAAWMKK